MAKILSFDPSGRATGWAYWDSKTAHSAIKCGVLKMPENANEYFTAEELGIKVNALIKDLGKPDFVVIEEMARANVGGSNAAAMIYAAGSAFAIIATVGNWGIPSGSIMPSTWRKMFFGEGFKPPLRKEKTKFVNDWKTAVVEECNRMSIELPTQKTIAHNAAEAVAMAICWRGVKINAGRHKAPFLELLKNRNERNAA